MHRRRVLVLVLAVVAIGAATGGCRGGESASSMQSVSVTFQPGLCDGHDPRCAVSTLSLTPDGLLHGMLGGVRTERRVDAGAAAQIFRLGAEAFDATDCGPIRPDAVSFAVVLIGSARSRSFSGTDDGCPPPVSEIARRLDALR